MKIIETDDDVLKVFLDDESICFEFENTEYFFTPLEADELAEILKKLCNKTKYIKGLKKE